MVLRIKKRFLEEIARHSQEVFPAEACGILVGRLLEGNVRVVEKVRRVKNIEPSPSTYLLDPEEQHRVFAEAEEEGLEVLGFYHSHPYWPARVSEVDRSRATYPGMSYAIYSLPEKLLRSFIFQEGEFTPEPVEVEA
ncbi:M67 family metallopeptidase [Candidatus Hecatella orcuttiae]|jgi:proteasome lid subunit RPN8/RPN11|uniref:M67 family metallopeptidase n=1 Tax=Candidatus Hecatella orcuttiae TaxID=1935119 RepID=UPI0028681B65|nr:M67 family metallopeptidase [Candidatus Hecatella orcuttiae]